MVQGSASTTPTQQALNFNALIHNLRNRSWLQRANELIVIVTLSPCMLFQARLGSATISMASA
tara:strand:- start:2127 stop:2315 length:189 start_codon:yes stop_codon:yes gene_type:complete